MEVSSPTIVNKTVQTNIYNNPSSSNENFYVETQNIKNISELNFNNIQNYSSADLKEIFRDNEQEQSKALLLKQLSQISNDKSFNKTIFEKARNMDNKDIAILSHTLHTSNSIDYYSDNILSYKNLDNIDEKKEIRNTNKLSFVSKEDSVAFLEQTIEYIETSVKYNKFMEHPEDSKKAQGFHDIFNEIKKDYIDNVNEESGVLAHYINYTKPLSLEEKQQQKDQEQIDLAMKAHGLDPKSNLDQFQFKLMQEGYSKDEAFERTQIYHEAGLIDNNEWFEKFGVRVYSLSMLAHNPILRESMMETYATMDTNELREVASRMSGGFSLSIEDMKKILGDEETSNPRDVMARAKKHWEELYGTPEKMMNMFNERLKALDQEQRFTAENIDYIKDGIYMIIEHYNKKIQENK